MNDWCCFSLHIWRMFMQIGLCKLWWVWFHLCCGVQFFCIIVDDDNWANAFLPCWCNLGIEIGFLFCFAHYTINNALYSFGEKKEERKWVVLCLVRPNFCRRFCLETYIHGRSVMKECWIFLPIIQILGPTTRIEYWSWTLLCCLGYMGPSNF